MASDPNTVAFLVYEEDPFVRADIEETLSASFPNFPVRVLDAVSDLAKLQFVEAQQSVAVISADMEVLSSLTRCVTVTTQHFGLVVISEAQNAMSDIGLACKVVGRPFKSETIVDAVRDVLLILQRSLP